METVMERQAGNMILRVEKDGLLEYVVIKTVAGQFELRLRSEMLNHTILRDFMESNEEDIYGSLATLWFLVISTAPDGVFFNDLVNAVNSCNERMAEEMAKNEEEEDEKQIIEDMEYAYSLAESIEENSKAE